MLAPRSIQSTLAGDLLGGAFDVDKPTQPVDLGRQFPLILVHGGICVTPVWAIGKWLSVECRIQHNIFSGDSAVTPATASVAANNPPI